MAVESSQQREASLLQTGLHTLSGLIAPLRKESAPPQQPALGFFTDTSICIGCKACEIACKQWNQLPATEPSWSGSSYDNTRQLGATTWRHVEFIEQIGRGARSGPPELPLLDMQLQSNGHALSSSSALPFFNSERWLMQSDVCKHCANAPCQEACPTGSIIRTEFDTVYVQQDICNGCGYCIVACPFGVIARDDLGDRQAHKCTLCYDRLKDGMQPACAKACPTTSIVFGEVEQLKKQARERLGTLQERGVKQAQLYGADDTILEGGLNSFFLLLDKPEVYNLPQNPQRPVRNVAPASIWTIIAASIVGLMGIIFFRE
jgi:formate dehydrogenase iron-sulfur subunit